MPHQCVRCNNFYDDGAKEIIKGCSCGGKLFFFIKKEKLEKIKNKEVPMPLNDMDKTQIEQDIYDMAGIEDKETPVVLDLESIRVLKPGKFELDLVRLLKGDPLIFKLASGKYVIDVAETFRRMSKK